MDTNLLNTSYPTWNFTAGGTSAGTFNVSRYDAGPFEGYGSITRNSGGAQITVDYDSGSTTPAGTQYRWIQMIDTSDPLGGSTTPYIDPRPNDDSLPFYWTNAEIPLFTSPTGAEFSDAPRRRTPLFSDRPVRWNSDLYLAEYDGGTDVDLQDGISWGWEMVANYEVTVDTVGSTPFNTDDFFHVSFDNAPDDIFLNSLSIDLDPVSAFFDPTNLPPGYAGSGLEFGFFSGLDASDITTTGLYDGSNLLTLLFADESFGENDSLNFGLDIDLWSNIDGFGATPDELNGVAVNFLFNDGYSITTSFDKFIASSFTPDWNFTQNPHSEPVPEPATLLLLCTGLIGVGFFRKRKKDV